MEEIAFKMKLPDKIRTFYIPGQEQAEKQPPVVWKLEYDVSHAVRFESMKNPVRHGHLYRNHRDLTKVTEKRIRAYERRQAMFSSEVKWCAHKVKQRMKQFRERTESINKTLKSKYSYNSEEWPELLNKGRADQVMKFAYERRPEGPTFISDRNLLMRGKDKNMAQRNVWTRGVHVSGMNPKVLPVHKIVVKKEMTL